MANDDIRVRDLDLDVRSWKGLIRLGLVTVGDVRRFKGSILKAKNFGSASFIRVKRVLEPYGITFDKNGIVERKADCLMPFPTSIRDYFAAQALSGMLAYPGDDRSGAWSNNASPGAVADQAYVYADAMLAAREAR